MSETGTGILTCPRLPTTFAGLGSSDVLKTCPCYGEDAVERLPDRFQSGMGTVEQHEAARRKVRAADGG